MGTANTGFSNKSAICQHRKYFETSVMNIIFSDNLKRERKKIYDIVNLIKVLTICGLLLC